MSDLKFDGAQLIEADPSDEEYEELRHQIR
jgi:hypothetical protein